MRKRKASSSKIWDVSQISAPLNDETYDTVPFWKMECCISKRHKNKKCFGCGGSVRQNVLFDPTSPWKHILISSNHCYLPEICCCYCCADVFCWLNKFLMGFIIVYMFVFFFTINSDNRSNQISVMCWLWTIANNCSKFGLGCLGLVLYLC